MPRELQQKTEPLRLATKNPAQGIPRKCATRRGKEMECKVDEGFIRCAVRRNARPRREKKTGARLHAILASMTPQPALATDEKIEVEVGDGGIPCVGNRHGPMHAAAHACEIKFAKRKRWRRL